VGTSYVRQYTLEQVRRVIVTHDRMKQERIETSGIVPDGGTKGKDRLEEETMYGLASLVVR
jgi:hypothetical protein